ncbi:MAG: NAD+ synthase [Solirubrobacterales bacterium]
MASDGGRVRLALAQINTTVGDIEGNAARIRDAIERARGERAELVILPELAVTGYPPEDLVLKRHFLAANMRALEEIASGVRDIVALVGYAEADGFVHNALGVLADGEVKASYTKMLLPNYGVFDERRYFEPGPSPALIDVNGRIVGLTICEDVWFPGPPAAAEALAGAGLIVNASASPYHHGKGGMREQEIVATRAREVGAAFALCNAVGGQDELVFDGHSVIIDERGETVARGAQFAEDLVVCDIVLPPVGTDRRPAEVPGGMDAPVVARLEVPSPSEARDCPPPSEPLVKEAEIYDALKLGLHDYVEKNGFQRVLVALSGGIDSALVALVATDALGPERVTCVVMPSPHSSAETQADARRIAANLGVDVIEIPIEGAMETYEELLADAFSRDSGEPGLAAENVQARIRGNLMMALSNRFGWLVLTTGNKSELSVGYATLYGDMAGGFAVIKDVFKTLAYELVRYRNGVEGRELVPESVLERPPTAELRPGQLDQDSLPPYELLDRILEAYVERDRGRDEIVAEGLPEDVVDEVIRMVDRSEYKRRQAPPGIKITPKAFGRDRRLPITNRFGG